MKANYKNYIIARATSNFGDSVFLQMCIIYLTSTTMSEVNLSINYLIISICGILIVFFGPMVDKIKNKKFYIIIFEILLLIFSIFIFIAIKFDLIILFFIMILFFNLFNNIRIICEFSFKNSLVKQKDLIKFNKYYNLTGNVFDQISNISSYYIISYFSYFVTTIINLITYLISISRLSKINIIEKEIAHPKSNVIQDIKSGYNHFKKGRIFVAITINDALLLSGYSLTNIYIPIFLYDTNQMYLYPLFLFIKALGFYVSTIYSEKIIALFKNNLTIFKIDYILNFISILLFIITKNFYLYLFLLFLVTIPQGVTGVLYEPIAFREYKHQYLSRIATYISFIFSTSTLLVLIINIILLKYNITIELLDVMIYYLIINFIVIVIGFLTFKKAIIKI